MSILYSTNSGCKPKSLFLDFAGNFRLIFGFLPIWPEAVSYASWQNLLKVFLWFLGSSDNFSTRNRRKKRKLSRRYRRYLQKIESQKNEITQQQTVEIVSKLEASEVTNNNDVGIGSSPAILFPHSWVTEITETNELGLVVDKHVGSTNVKQHEGAFGILTDNLIKRKESLKIATIGALSVLKKKNWYHGEKS